MSTGTATAKVNVTIKPAQGTGPTNFGIFNISVMPLRPTDQILNLQYIVSLQGQPQGDFTSFVYIGDLAPGQGFNQSQLYASCSAVMANRQGKALVVQIAGGVNTTSNAFDISQTFSNVLWPQGSCD